MKGISFLLTTTFIGLISACSSETNNSANTLITPLNSNTNNVAEGTNDDAGIVIKLSEPVSEQAKASNAILLQGFHWNSKNYDRGWYEEIRNNTNRIKDLGVSHVWFPPVSDSTSNNGYLPRQLYVVYSYYGNESDLRTTIATLNAEGIHSIADIVINHRVGTTGWGDFTNPTWGNWATTSDDEWGQGTGNPDTGASYESGRDLDHTNVTVQNDIITWIKDFLFADIGFSGIRYDYAKGYAPYYAAIYANAVSPNFCVGELWNGLDYSNVDAHRQELMDYVDDTGGVCGAFDFTTKGLLNRALSENDYGVLSSDGLPAGGIGWWPQKMVTFVDNHDTGPSETCDDGQQHWPAPCDKIIQGYAYILTHPGIPTLYWPHIFNWGNYDEIQKLTDIRIQQGINSKSNVDIQVAEQGLYAAIIDEKVAMKIGPNDWYPGSDWTLATSGLNYAIWILN